MDIPGCTSHSLLPGLVFVLPFILGEFFHNNVVPGVTVLESLSPPVSCGCGSGLKAELPQQNVSMLPQR